MVLIALCKFSADEDRETTEDEEDGALLLEASSAEDMFSEERVSRVAIVTEEL